MSRLSARLDKLELQLSSLRLMILQMSDEDDATALLASRGIEAHDSDLVVSIRTFGLKPSAILSIDGVQWTDEMETAALERLGGHP